MFKGKTIVLGVCGGIAAYWSAELAGQLKNMKADVHVIMTRNAAEFITPLTLRILSQNPVMTGMFANGPRECVHVSLAREADFLVIAPATADIIGKVANGIADDLLSTTVMAAEAPVVFCPAMNSRMWANRIVQENVVKLKRHEHYFVGPEFGEMACGGKGLGRLASIRSIVDTLIEIGNAGQKE